MSLVDARIEIEEFLKNQVMDFSNYKERVEEKKKNIPLCSKNCKKSGISGYYSIISYQL